MTETERASKLMQEGCVSYHVIFAKATSVDEAIVLHVISQLTGLRWMQVYPWEISSITGIPHERVHAAIGKLTKRGILQELHHADCNIYHLAHHELANFCRAEGVDYDALIRVLLDLPGHKPTPSPTEYNKGGCCGC